MTVQLSGASPSMFHERIADELEIATDSGGMMLTVGTVENVACVWPMSFVFSGSCSVKVYSVPDWRPAMTVLWPEKVVVWGSKPSAV